MDLYRVHGDPPGKSTFPLPGSWQRPARPDPGRSQGVLQRAAIDRSPGPEVPPIVHDVLRSPGQPLDAASRASLEPRFGRDFSQVRVHSDAQAAESARAVGALAYTVGRDVVFAAGQHAPATSHGRGLLAHELAHVVQQAGGSAPSHQALQVGAAGSAQEQQAESVVAALAAGRAAPSLPTSGPQVMRATRTFALTFDDGPHAAPLGKGQNRTEKVLEVLKSKGVHAGFFIQTGVSYRGANAVGRALTARMSAEGHTVGIHTGGTADHELHTQAEAAGRLGSELQSAQSYIQTETGTAPTFVRPPTGRSNPAVLATYRRLGLTNLLWDIDGDQGRNLALPELKQRLDSGVRAVHGNGWQGSTPANPKIVVLYHDIQKGTADHIGTLIDDIKRLTTTLSGGQDTADFAAP